jgi:HSP20 family protein
MSIDQASAGLTGAVAEPQHHERAQQKTDKTDTYYAYECSYGSFSRAFTLPEGVDGDKVKAELKDGVLTVELPKPPGLQPKKIAVKSA